MKDIPKVLFVCVENSCRSQMAEGFARHFGEGIIEAWSAGSAPSGLVHPRAVELMREKGIDLDGQISKGLADLPKVRWDYVVTMGCGERCPNVTADHKVDWDIPDPKLLPIDKARDARDAIERKVIDLVQTILSRGVRTEAP